MTFCPSPLSVRRQTAQGHLWFILSWPGTLACFPPFNVGAVPLAVVSTAAMIAVKSLALFPLAPFPSRCYIPMSLWSLLQNQFLRWGEWLSDRISLPQTSILVGTFTALLVFLMQQGGLLQPLELLAFDQLVRWQAQSYTDPHLLIVAITEADLKVTQQWPLQDQTLAHVLQTLQQYQPRVIGLDLYRDLPTPPGYDDLQEQLSAPNVVGIRKLPDASQERVLPPPALSSDRVAFNDFVLDPDGVVRRNFLYAPLPTGSCYSLGLRLALAYVLGNPTPPIGPPLNPSNLPRLPAQGGGYAAIDNTGYQVLVDYRSVLQPEQVTLSQVLGNELDPAQVRDRIVLVGTTATSVQRQVLTPYSAIAQDNPFNSGLWLQAQLTSQLLHAMLGHQALPRALPLGGVILWLGLWGWFGASLVLWCPDLGALLVTGMGASLGLGGLTAVALTQNIWVPAIAPNAVLLGSMVIMALYRAVYNSFHDVLTGLPNRSRFLRSLTYALHDKGHPAPPQVTVLFIALNRFSLINDTLGYAAGDRLLLQARDQLQACLDQCHTCRPLPHLLARIGGDEFGLMLTETATANGSYPHSYLRRDRPGEYAAGLPAQCDSWDLLHPPFTLAELAIHLAGQISARLEQILGGDTAKPMVLVNSSIGIVFAPADGTHGAVDMLRDAHAAMYRAKALGRSHYEVFAVGLHAEMTRRLGLELNLRQAIEREELQVYYQPIVDLKTQKLVGFEALVRWWHPQQGFMSPSAFVEVAEESGLIIPLDQWVLEQACEQLQRWRTYWSQTHDQELHLILNVNLSSKQFSRANVVETVAGILQRTGLPGYYLKLEITERVALPDQTDLDSDRESNCIDTMLALKALDICLSLDDFGTGYSALSYLCRFPIDTLKIDKSFVSRIPHGQADRTLVKNIVNLSHDLGINVTAEGIETQEQVNLLRQWSCDYGQGYFFSKPLSPEAAQIWLDRTLPPSCPVMIQGTTGE